MIFFNINNIFLNLLNIILIIIIIINIIIGMCDPLALGLDAKPISLESGRQIQEP